MAENRGKKFEDAIKTAFSKFPNVSVDRLLDPQAGYAGIRNICDFIIYKKPYEIYMECKSLYGNTLNFKGMITENQWNGLQQKAEIDGVIAGVMIWFIDHGTTAFVPITELVRLEGAGAKSLNIKDIQNDMVSYIPLEGKKKRVFFEYDPSSFFKTLYYLEGGKS